MKQILLILFFMTFGAQAWSAGAPVQYRRGCTLNVMPTSSMQTVLSEETNEITRVTGIRIFELTSNVFIQQQNETLRPPSAQKSYNFALKLSTFLTTFPLSFLQRNAGICIVLTDKMVTAAAMTISNIVFLGTDVPLSTIAHEMIHAIDNMNFRQNYVTTWNAINANGNCTYRSYPTPNIARYNLSEINSCFVSSYGESETWEDRAEIFGAMVQDYNNLKRKTPANSALLEKINAIQDYLSSFSPEMGVGYWANRPSFNDGDHYNSCGSSLDTDTGCKFEDTQPANASWSLR